MRRLMTALAIGSIMLGIPWAAGAKTPGRLCRAECQPRIEEQCAGTAGRAKRRCRKPLLRACRTTTPGVACQTTDALTRELGDRRLQTGDPVLGDVTLCASGTFSLRDAGARGLGRIRSGAWTVRIAGGALTLALDDATAAVVSHDTAGRLVVDGRPATTTDATARCTADDDPVDVPVDDPGDAPPPPPPPTDDTGRVIDAVRAVTDRILTIAAPDGNVDQQQDLILCGSGVAIDSVSPVGNPAGGNFVRGTWTVEASGASLVLALETDGGGTPRFAFEVRADGSILLDGAVVAQRDARQECDDATLTGRLTDALENRAFFFTVQQGPFPIRHKLGLCDTRRFRLDTTSTRVGTWRVFVANGVANLLLDADGNGPLQAFPLAFDTNGTATVQGTTPIDDPSLVEAACQS